jgi:hypothetical protein
MTETHRARRHLETIARPYPGAWKWFDDFRADRQALGGWSETVFCPLQCRGYGRAAGSRASGALRLVIRRCAGSLP